MDESTTTDAPADAGAVQSINGVAIDDQGMALAAQPDESTESAEAVQETTDKPEQKAEAEQEETPEQPETKTEPSDDDKLKSWAENKGLTLDSDNAIKAAKMARDAEKAMHSKAQKASELEKAIDTGITEEAKATGFSDEERLDIVRLKTKMSVRDFFDSKPDAKQYEQAMIDTLTQKPHLAGDLDSLYAVARMSDSGAIKSQGKREALESLAQKQTAAVPTGNAVTSTTPSSAITPQNVDQLVGANSLEWFSKNQDAINKAMAG